MQIDFIFWLFVLTISSGVISAIDKLKFEQKRLSPIKDHLDSMTKKERKKFLHKEKSYKAPIIADYSRSLFSVFLIVFLLRGIFIGNYLIPTASMTPTLPVGNFILVNQTAYGIRNPITNKTWIKTSTPKRGDVVVFHYPVNTNVDYIKRVIGVPGDTISYQNKRLIINGKPLQYTNCLQNQVNHYNGENSLNEICTENLDGVKHKIDTRNGYPSINFSNLVVPKGQYLVMGDNRDNSEDGRYWGFVPEEDLLGKAILVWFSWNSLNKSIRWNELGKIT